MENIKYSVIVPIYNAEKTLERCLKSITWNKRTDVELILINDGSTDGSEQIILEFQKKYQDGCQVLYIVQSNTGVSKARNVGLELAKGKYITFVDSDDYVSKKYFEILDTMEDSDLCVFGSRNSNKSRIDEAQLFEKMESLESNDERLQFLLSSRLIMPPWNKRYKNAIIQKYQLRYTDKFQIGEDFDFNLSYGLKCHSMAFYNSYLYCVDISDRTSLSRKYRPHLDESMTTVFKHIEYSINTQNSNEYNKQAMLNIIDYLFIKNMFSCIAEEFKCKKPNYIRDRKQIVKICQMFTYRIGDRKLYCNIIHHILRTMLRYHIIFPIYMVAYLAKWNTFSTYIEEGK